MSHRVLVGSVEMLKYKGLRTYMVGYGIMHRNKLNDMSCLLFVRVWHTHTLCSEYCRKQLPKNDVRKKNFQIEILSRSP